MLFQKISVIGLGYIGLPTAAIFASNGKKVLGVDINQNTVDTINEGKIHIVEPELDQIINDVVNNGLLRASTSTETSDAFLIAVPTPFLPKNNDLINPKPDLSYIKSAIRSVSKVLKKGDLVILESTSPVGTTEQVALWLSQNRQDLTFPHTHGEDSDIRIAYCPERVLPGKVIKELVENDRIIGGMTHKCSSQATELYKIFTKGDCIETDSRTAEMVKLTENASRDVSIAFANELSIICDKMNINVWELITLANHHPRVDILQPGPGVGGHCIAVDPWFIVDQAPEEANLIKSARKVNDSKPDWVIDRVNDLIDDYLKENNTKSKSEINVVCLGLTFKANIDDVRESPALAIFKKLDSCTECNIIAVDPHVTESNNPLLKDIKLYNLYTALDIADILVLLVDHMEFKDITVNKKWAIDTRGIWK